ncbi:ABC transporter ATP-binding protein [Candidatus Poribacteria bacterium]|nr:MAG: ABC transporter ATP-binding protein [Candidatus Poribacteria bacterium]
MSNHITVENLTHTYDTRCALDHVNFSVSRGEVFGFLGPNGSGKTTLFKILSTLITPTSGVINIFGHDIYTERKLIRKLLGVVFQQPALDGKLTVIENLRHQGHLYGLRGRQLNDRINELLKQFNLNDRTKDLVEELSGGLQRRVEIAKALLHSPQVLLLDEPSSGLDIGVRRQLSEYLSVLAENEGICILLTTHLMDEADECKRVAILDDGRLVALGSPDELKSQIGGDVVSVETKNNESLYNAIEEKFHVSTTITEDYIHIESTRANDLVKDIMVAFPDDILSVRLSKPTLEDVFIKLTGSKFV